MSAKAILRLLDLALWSVLVAGGFAYGFLRNGQSNLPLASIIAAVYVIAAALYFLARNRVCRKLGE